MQLLLLCFLALIPKYFYSVKDTTSIAGEVIKVERERVEGSKVYHIVLSLSRADTIYRVILGPAWFIEEVPGEGDSCLVDGAVFYADSGVYIIARKLVNMRTKSIVTLRTKVGFPLWGRRGNETRAIGGSGNKRRRQR